VSIYIDEAGPTVCGELPMREARDFFSWCGAEAQALLLVAYLVNIFGSFSLQFWREKVDATKGLFVVPKCLSSDSYELNPGGFSS
jgi:hypothetical protein